MLIMYATVERLPSVLHRRKRSGVGCRPGNQKTIAAPGLRPLAIICTATGTDAVEQA